MAPWTLAPLEIGSLEIASLEIGLLQLGHVGKAEKVGGISPRCWSQIGNADADQAKVPAVGLPVDERGNARKDQLRTLGWMRQTAAARENAEIGRLEFQDDAQPS